MAKSHESSPAAPPADSAEVVPAASTDPGASNETMPPTVDSATGGGETTPDPVVNTEPQRKETYRTRLAGALDRIAYNLRDSQDKIDQKRADREQVRVESAVQDGSNEQDLDLSMNERARIVARGIGSIASRIKDRIASSWLFTEAKRIVSEEIEMAKENWQAAQERKKKRKEEREKRRQEAREKREQREKELREQYEQQKQQAELAKQEAQKRKAERKAKRGKNIEKAKSAVRTAYEKSARAVGATIGGIVVFGDRVKHAVEAAKIAWQEYGKETSDSNAESDADTDAEDDADSSTDPENSAA